MSNLADRLTENAEAAHARLRHESERKYRRLFETIDEGFCVVEKVEGCPAEAPNFRYVDANPAFLAQVGDGEVVGKTVRQVLPSEAQEWWLETYGNILETGQPQRFERAGSSGRVFEIYAFRVDDGAQRSVAALFKDISERKQAEAHLRESEARLRAIFDGTYTFIGLLSPDGVVLESNRAALEWMGCTREETNGRKFWETPWWSQTPGAAELVHRAIDRAREGEFVREEVTLSNHAGPAVFDFSLHPVRDDMGRITLLVPEGREITERLRAAREIERRYRDGLKLTEINRTLVGALELDEVTQIVCRAARELIGADAATFVLREGPRVRYVAEDAIAPLWNGQNFPIEECISGWSMQHSAVAIVKDIALDLRIPYEAYRRTFVRSLVMTPVGPGLPVAAIGVYWQGEYEASAYEVELLQSLASAADLALAGVRAYDEARRATAEATAANRLKDEFLATLSHELRNPLNSIVGYSDLLLRSADAQELPLVRKAAATIYGNAQAQARLINDLLDLSRLQTGKLAIERRPVNVVALVADAVETVRPEAADKGVALEVELPPAPLLIDADAVRVQQVVWNLLNNAVKFTPRAGAVSVSVRELDGQVDVVVADTGQGIEPGFLPHVFEMFRQGDGRLTRVHGGLGIGLALVRQLVELHGGRVSAHSSGPGQGARFSVTLPLHSALVTRDGDAPRAPKGELAGARILIVDDTADSVDMLRLLLTGEGATVVTACDGAAALSAAEDSDFDLIVSDISMPVMDGYEFMSSLRQHLRHQKTPAIALTGFGRDEDVKRARQAGFTTQLTKPLNFANLIELARLTLCK